MRHSFARPLPGAVLRKMSNVGWGFDRLLQGKTIHAGKGGELRDQRLIVNSNFSIAEARRAIGRSREAVARGHARNARTHEHTALLDARDAHSEQVNGLFVHVVVATSTLAGSSYFEATPTIVAHALGIDTVLFEVDPAGKGQLLGQSDGLAATEAGDCLRGYPWLGEHPAMTVYASGAAGDLGEHAFLRDARSYLAVPLNSSKGELIGYIGCISARVWSSSLAVTVESLLRLIAPRASVELERHHLHRRLSDNTQLFRQFSELSDDLFISWSDDDTNRLKFVSGALTRHTGFTQDDVTRNPEVLLGPLRDALRNGSPGVDWANVVLIRKDGAPVSMQARFSGMHHAHHWSILRRARLEDEDAADAALLRQMLEQLPFAAILVQQGRVRFMNDRAVDLTGATAEHLMALAIAPANAEQEGAITTLGEWLGRVSSTRSTKGSLKLLPRRRAPRYVQMRTRPLQLADGPALLLAPFDLTQQRVAVERLQQQADLDERVLEALPIEMIAVDAAGRVLLALGSGRRARRDGAESDRRCWPLVAAGDDLLRSRDGSRLAREVFAGIGGVLSGTVPDFFREYEETDGSEDRCYVVAANPLDGGGAIITCSDVTAIKRAEREIAAKEQGQREILQSLPDQLARITADGNIVDVVMPSHRSNMVTLFPSAAFRRRVEELLPDEAAQLLLKTVQDAIGSNSVTICTIQVPFEEVEREYEMRAVPISQYEVMVSARDKTAEQWIPNAYGGEAYGNGQRAARVVRENPYSLTFREVAVLELMSQGASDKEIAAKLGVSVFTVYKHVSKILHKMNAASRTEASLRTVREHLFD